ncbi:hypothetical protein [Thiomicrorhabdus aquaedulcis]|uniref:hypothetical protein n=1 Tax=Thiomicrorhabdus aquaedulcis TaxID=2211106 RepID=UPI000FD7C7B6|nr:hypothetical protein [Thiomicrorhabdus aquaedulcis]
MFTVILVWVALVVLWPLILSFILVAQRVFLVAVALPYATTRKLAYDLGLVSISAGGFSVLAGITQQSSQDEIVFRVLVSLIFIFLGAIIVYRNIEKN